MARTIHRLKPITLTRKMTAGYHADGGGLYLQVTDAGAKSWIFRYSIAGKRREMGLGPYSAKTTKGADKRVVSLHAARERSAEARALVKSGKDPIAVREAQQAQERLERARGVTFDQAVELFLESHEEAWKNPKHRQQWRNTLKTYAGPKIGSLSIADIGTPEVTKVLEPIWRTKPETASRLRGRIERILDWARVRQLREGENPARWRGHLDKVFAARSKLRKVKHHAAVPIDDLPAVYAKLKVSRGIAAKALRFAILTAARAGETVHATWAEMNLDDGIWTVPASRMKAGKEHRVTLSREALAILKDLHKVRTGPLVFVGNKRKALSLTSLSKALRTAGGEKATVHGMRSTFKDWCSERTSFPSEVSEMALAHSIGDKVEAAYRRGELLEKRRAMMDQWATFLASRSTAKVVPIGARRRSA
ncbi:MAG TPA: integrase arm-type DNA-binding domain-containing protein [Reyranella sp.]|jgi:integrase|nr:integrase arm-type DNA-binding domain-containing protein [Reyranella sp.]